MGALSYADDLSILEPTYHACQKMLHVCDEFAREFNVIFNSSKSIVIVFNKKLKRDIPSLQVAGAPIPYVDNAMHLGSYIGPNSHKFNLKKAVQDMNSQVNLLVANFANCHFDSLMSFTQKLL